MLFKDNIIIEYDKKYSCLKKYTNKDNCDFINFYLSIYKNKTQEIKHLLIKNK
jgi:hypothetical protein